MRLNLSSAAQVRIYLLTQSLSFSLFLVALIPDSVCVFGKHSLVLLKHVSLNTSIRGNTADVNEYRLFRTHFSGTSCGGTCVGLRSESCFVIISPIFVLRIKAASFVLCKHQSRYMFKCGLNLTLIRD